MATMTAQMLIGQGQQHGGGFEPTHYAFLSENGRAAWILKPENQAETGQAGPAKKIVWIPADDNILNDGLLMVAVHVVKDKGVIAGARGSFRNPDLADYQLLPQVHPTARENLYNMCKRLDYRFKIVLTVLSGSSLMSELSVLEDYALDVDVCVTRYSRRYSHMTNETIIRGSLNNL